jgi:D-alanyl-D-alanine carboxypeptidase/D-alanyl-D-alanine-endopeptidase (penicillin-binding protein 4)
MASRPRASVGLLCALLLLLAAAPAASAYGGPALRAKLTREMRLAGPFAGAYVRDLGSGRGLFAEDEDVARIPASVNKLFTTSATLLRMGPDTRLVTTVAGAGALTPDGTWGGDLYLQGAGVPSLDRAAIRRLARDVRRQGGVRRVTGSVLADESLFDTLRGSARSSFGYDADIGGVLSAVAVGHGWSRDGSPAAEAARRLAAALRAEGVPVRGRSGRAVTPGTAVPVGTVASPTVGELIRATNVPSDNFAAEMLLKGLGARFGAAGSTPAGADVVRGELAALGVHPRIVDGSGLSRQNRTTPRQVVRLLERMHNQPVARAFETSLPVAGRTGTISRRMRGTPAQDRCRAKTGTLSDVSALAGVCRTASGREIAFAFLMNRAGLVTGRRVQDRMAAAIARLDV